jgi:hypothetical protein
MGRILNRGKPARPEHAEQHAHFLNRDREEILKAAERPSGAQPQQQNHLRKDPTMQLAHPEGAIRERAYAIWEAEGRPDGRAFDHWNRASREIFEPRPIGEPAEHAPPIKAKPRKRTGKGRA